MTAGSLPVFAIVRPARRLIRVDFPTFGMPTIIAVRGPTRDFPRPGGNSARRRARISRTVSLESERTASAADRSDSSAAIQTSLATGSARSARVMIRRRGLSPMRASSAGFELLQGNRASMTSTTASTSGRAASISLPALCM